MSSILNKGEKPKAKFAQSNINHLYKGNASETHTKPTIRTGGLQLVGKLQGTRRIPPPPPWMPSLKAEMGGQDTRINIVPPGGSGWGTGPTASTSEGSTPVTQTEPSSTSILKDITKNQPLSFTKSATNSVTNENGQLNSLVKPPQKPFFATRPTKASVLKNSVDSLPDLNTQPLAKPAGPAVPFYQRSTPVTSKQPSSPKKEESPETTPLPETSHSPTTLAVPSNGVTQRVGWAAVATEEPDFQETIVFSDDEDNTDMSPCPTTRSKQPLSDERTWSAAPMKASLEPPIPPYPQSAWESPVSRFPPAPPITTFSTHYSQPSENMYQRHTTMMPERGTIHDMSITDPLSAARAFGAMTVCSTEAQAQAQREARTLEYKSAVSKAQMARKKHTSDSESDSRCRDSIHRRVIQKIMPDTSVFSQQLLSPSAASIYPINSGIGPGQQSNRENSFAAFAASCIHFLPSTAPNPNNQAQPPPMKVPMTSSMLPQWGSPNTLSGSSQTSQFIPHHPPFTVANSPKLPNQNFYSEAIMETLMETCHQQTSQSGQDQMMPTLSGNAPLEASKLPTDDINQYMSMNMLISFPDTSEFQRCIPVKSDFTSSQSKQFDHHLQGESNERSQLPVDNSTDDRSQQQQQQQLPLSSSKFTNSAQSDKSRTFTPLSSSAHESGSQLHSQHITPLMEVDLSGTYSEKNFDGFPPHQSYQHGPGSKLSRNTRGAHATGVSRRTGHNAAAGENPDQSRFYPYSGNKSARQREYTSNDFKKSRNNRYGDGSTPDTTLDQNEFANKNQEYGDSHFEEGDEQQTYDTRSTKSYNRGRRTFVSGHQPRGGANGRICGYPQTASANPVSSSNRGSSGGGTFPRLSRAGGGGRGTSNGSGGGRFTRSGRNAEYEDYYGPVGYSSHGKLSNTTLTSNESGTSYEGDQATRQHQSSHPWGKRRGQTQGYKGLSHRGDLTEDSHKSQPKNKPIVNFSRSGVQQNRRYPIHTREDNEESQRYNSSVPRDQQNAGQRMNGSGTHEGDRTELSEQRYLNRKNNPKNTGSQQHHSGNIRSNASNTGDMASSTTESSENSHQQETPINSITPINNQDPQEKEDADTTYRHGNTARRGGGKQGMRLRRQVGSKYRNSQQTQKQFRSDDTAHHRHDRPNRHHDDDDDDDHHRDGIGSGKGNALGRSNQNANNAYSTGGDVGGKTSANEPTTQAGSGHDSGHNHQNVKYPSDSVEDTSAAIVRSSAKGGVNGGLCRRNGAFVNSGSYGKSYQSKRGGSSYQFFSNISRIPPSEDVGLIVPLMSINAEAPPSFSDANFLDSPSDFSDISPDTPIPSSKPTVTVDTVDDDSKDDQIDDAVSVKSPVQASNDGFMEVLSKSSKKQRHKNQALASQEKKVPAIGERRKDTKPRGAKSQGFSSISPKTETKTSKRSTFEVSPKVKPATTPSSSLQSQKPVSKKPDDEKVHMPVRNAWSKPLQTTIDAPVKDKTSASSEESRSDNAKTSYAWSKVVGSRPSDKTPANLTDSSKSDVPATSAPTKSPQHLEAQSLSNPESITVSAESVLEPLNGISSPSLSSKPKTDDSFDSSLMWPEAENQKSRPTFPSSGVNGGLHSSTAVISSAGPSGNVCKVRPQKQPQPPTTTSAVPVSSPSPLLPQTSIPETFISSSAPLPLRQPDLISVRSTANSTTSLPQNYSSSSVNQPPPSSPSEYSQFSQQQGNATTKPLQQSQKTQFSYEASTADMTTVSWPLFDKSYATNQMSNPALSGTNLPLDFNLYSSDQSLAGKNCAMRESDSLGAPPPMYLPQHPAHSPFRHSLQPMPVGQQPQGSLIGLGLNEYQHHQNVRATSQNENYFQRFATTPTHNSTVPTRGLYSFMQSRNLAQWQQPTLDNAHPQHTGQASNGLLVTAPGGPQIWPSQFESNYQQPQHGPGMTPIASSYVGVIGGDRPSSTLSQNRMASAHSNQSSLYGAAPSPQHSLRGPPMPSNHSFLSGGLYAGAVASSPPPPPQPTHGGMNTFDPNFAYANGISGAPLHSSGLYSQNPASHRQHQMHNHHPLTGSSTSRSGGPELPPPTQQALFINPQGNAYTVQVPVAASAGNHSGLHF